MIPVKRIHETSTVVVLSRQLSKLDDFGGLPALARSLHSDIKTGLTPEQVRISHEVFGRNQLPVKRRKSFLQHLLESLNDLTLIILMVAAGVTILFGIFLSKQREDWIQGLAIFLAVAVVSTVTSVTNYLQDGEFESLAKVKEDRLVQVIRSGVQQAISIYDVAVGDVFVMRAGEVLPCDGIFIRGNGVVTNESSMTGESKQVHKSREDPFMVGGSTMDAGAGAMLVTTVGENTSYGKIVRDLQSQEAPETPLQVKLDGMAKMIGYVGMGFGAATFIVLTIGYFLTNDDYDNAVVTVLSFFIVAITIVVVAVPEGLPLAVTISLSFSMRQMTADQSLVRELQACETMGSATAICSDKTGTLTTNRMTVVRGWFFGDMSDSVPSAADIGGSHNVDALFHAIARNADAQIEYLADGGLPVFKDNKTECALLHMLHEQFELDFDEERSRVGQPFFRENFSSERKRMSSVYLVDASRQLVPLDEEAVTKGSQESMPYGDVDGFVLYCKGASEIILDRCTSYRAADGSTVPITDSLRRELAAVIDQLATSGLRTLCVAERFLSMEQAPCLVNTSQQTRDELFTERMNSLETDLTLFAICGIKDPVRDQVPAAVLVCRKAGIRVRMVTGDNLKTARHIAEECGIVDDEYNLCMEGREYRRMEDSERLEMLPNLAVLARSNPRDKLKLVRDLQQLHEVVAVTGDGTNDAPALKAAHVGLSMGISGTEVANEASKIVILDDNFASIVKSVKWGRSVMENIRRFLTFQLTINAVALMVTFVIACTNGGDIQKFPITPVQLLWINLIMDSFAALALATEPPSEDLLLQKPNGLDDPLITRIMWKMLLGHTIWQTFLVLFLTLAPAGNQLFGVDTNQNREHLTNVFNTFVFLQLWNKLNCRKLHDELKIWEGFLEARLAMIILGIIVVMQVFIVEVGGEITATSHLSAGQWFTCIGLGATSIPVGYILRLIPWYDADDALAHRGNV